MGGGSKSLKSLDSNDFSNLKDITKYSILATPFVFFRNSYHRRQLLKYFVKRDLAIKYKYSFLGYLWSLLEPLALTVTFYLLFQILTESKDPLRVLNIMVGILTFRFFTTVTTGTMTSLSKNSGLIKSIYIPREFFVFSNAAFQLVIFLLSLLICIPLMLYYGFMPSEYLLYVVVVVLNLGLLGMGLGMCLAPFHPIIEDIEKIIGVLLRMAFYLTPVFYTWEFMQNSGRIPTEFLDTYLLINPVAVWVTLNRTAFTNTHSSIEFSNFMFSSATTIVIFFIGCVIFSRHQHKAVNYL